MLLTRHGPSLLTFRWRRGVAIAACALLGTVAPAVFGAAIGLPEPLFHDEYSYILGADTFASGRLTNPSPLLPEFFEAPHVIVTPTYQSKYPPGQALVLAVGQVLFGHPIWGVWIGCGLFGAALCWMLQSWVPKHWALATTVLTILTLGTTSYWAQSYWGGMVAAAGGALVFGGMRRTLRTPTRLSSILMSFGVVVLVNTRPFEGLLVVLPTAVVLTRWMLWSRRQNVRVKLLRFALPAVAALIVGLTCTAIYNRTVTGDFWLAPYSLHLEQYFHQNVFLFSTQREPARKPVERLAAFYRHYAVTPPEGTELVTEALKNLTLRLPVSIAAAVGLLALPTQGRPHFIGVTLWLVLLSVSLAPRARLPPVYVAAVAILIECLAWLYMPNYPWPLAPFLIAAWTWTLHRTTRPRDRWWMFIAATTLLVAIGQALVLWWLPHYIAPLVPLISAALARAFLRCARQSLIPASRVGVALSVLLVGHGLALSILYGYMSQTTVETPHLGLTHPQQVRRQLMARRGLHLVFVSYDKTYAIHRDWVYNAADLPNTTVIFAHDKGRHRNRELLAAYPTRTAWMLHVSSNGAHLSPY